MKEESFDDETIYHVYNRGVDKRDIFLDTTDYRRFYQNLILCNSWMSYEIYQSMRVDLDGPPTSIVDVGGPEDRLVEILCYCLMPNHFHFMLRASVNGGMGRFMGKLGNAYTKYFNTRYERSGHLFQGKYQRKEVETNDQLTYLIAYIHGNPVFASLVKDPENWKWSSYKSFMQPESAHSITIDKNLFEYGSRQHTELVRTINEEKQTLAHIDDLLLE